MSFVRPRDRVNKERNTSAPDRDNESGQTLRTRVRCEVEPEGSPTLVTAGGGGAAEARREMRTEASEVRGVSADPPAVLGALPGPAFESFTWSAALPADASRRGLCRCGAGGPRGGWVGWCFGGRGSVASWKDGK